MDAPLTARQQAVLDAIRRHLDMHGVPPTRAELAAAMGFRSPNAAEEHLRALARKGAIALTPGASRGLRVKAEPPGLPVVGRVAAGSPMLAVEQLEGRLMLDGALFRPRADYLLRVRGESMSGAGILDGDLLAVHRAGEARDGQIVVARVDGEVTVKRYRRRGTRVTLRAENPAFAPIEVDLRHQELVIEGLGVGVLRGAPVPAVP
jgi:repressor LexA